MTDFPEKSIGLCLSGGGFRAALYHLGVLRYLAEAGQLGNVSSISSVSGGSIIAGVVAVKWEELRARDFTVEAFMELVYDPFVKMITHRNLRNRWLACCVPALPRLIHRHFSFIDLWSDLFDSWFYHGKETMMNDLPKDLDLVINATNLRSAKAYRIARNYHGDNDENYNPYQESYPVRLSDAVAASAAQVPKHIWFRGDHKASDKTDYCIEGRPDTNDTESGQWFMDGGVYDNTALDWYLNWENPGKVRPPEAKRPEFIIVSDASPQLRSWEMKRRNIITYWLWLGRVFDISQEQTRRTRKDRFIETLQTDCKLNEGIIISIDQVGTELEELKKGKRPDGTKIAPDEQKMLMSLGFPKGLVEERIRLIRTDLNNFLESEAELLAYHSYSLMHVYLRVFQKDNTVAGNPVFIDGTPAWNKDRTDKDIKNYCKQLEDSASHFSRKRVWL